MKNNFLFIRHGESTSNAYRTIAAQSDVPLTQQGIQQSQEIALSLKDQEIVRVISSNLSRAKDTAEIIAAEHGLTVDVWTELNEIDAGAVTGEPVIPGKSPIERAIERNTGESLEALELRAHAVITKLTNIPKVNGTIAIIGHKTFGSVIFAVTKGLSKEHFVTYNNTFSLKNAEGRLLTLK